MCDEYEVFEFLEDDATEENTERKIRRIKLRDSGCDPFSLDDVQFVKRYRLTKDCNLCDELRPYMTEPKKYTDLSVETRVLVALSFFATGSYQRPIGDIAAHSLAQPTVSTAISQVVKALNLPQMRAKYIKFPRTTEENRRNIFGFYNKFGMPGVLGCIDCTHVAIIRPTENEERFYCRKQYHSLNVQLICNADMEIISVDASYGGATHDSFIWTNHPLKAHMEELSRNESIWLLGDSGYPLRRYMMTPTVGAPLGSPEAFYTDLHIKTRNIIERTIGILKARFRCLLVHRVLHYSPQVAGSIVNACVILHNICNRANVPVQELADVEVVQESQMQPMSDTSYESVSTRNSALDEGSVVRWNLITRISLITTQRQP